MTGVRITHIGGPTTLIEIDGWRLLTDPTFDPAGGSFARAPDEIRRCIRWLPVGVEVEIAA